MMCTVTLLKRVFGFGVEELDLPAQLIQAPQEVKSMLCLMCCRYKPPNTETNPTLEDPTPDYMNLLGMIFSMCGLMLKVTPPP